VLRAHRGLHQGIGIAERVAEYRRQPKWRSTTAKPSTCTESESGPGSKSGCLAVEKDPPESPETTPRGLS
jgi:hypothetical protein